MGNTSTKDQGEDLLREAVQRLLEAPVFAVGGREEQDEIWDDIFHCGVNQEAFYESVSTAEMLDMRDLQPGNLKLLSRKALSNISRFMESRRPGPGRPSVDVVLNSVRVLTRTIPALFSDPALHSWCWRRRRMEYILMYLAESDETNNVGAQEGDSDDDESNGEDQGGGDPKQWNVVEDFPVCFAAVMVHCITNLLAFPGFAIDEEATDWDDHYTPIPELHYGIREASIIWAPGIAVTEHNMREVAHFDHHRVEVLRLLVTALSLPLFLDMPSTKELEEAVQDGSDAANEESRVDQSLQDQGPKTPRGPRAATASHTLPGVPLANPLATIVTSRHLPFSTELFYSLLNVAVLEGSPAHGSGALATVGSVGGGRSRPKGLRRTSSSAWRSFVFGGGGRGGANEDVSSFVEWCLQTLALLLRDGKPYKHLIEDRGFELTAEGDMVFGTIPRHIEVSVESDPAYNCHRRCVFVVHSNEDLDCIALGLLRHLNDARLGKTRRPGSVLAVQQETLMVFAAFVHENPRFVPRLAASEDLARGTAVCMCNLLEDVVNALIDKDDGGFSITVDGTDDNSEAAATVSENAAQSDPESGVGGLAAGGGGVGSGATAGSGSSAEGEGVAGLGRRGGRKAPLGSDVGLILLASRLLLALSEDERFMGALAVMPAGGRRGEFSAPEMETEVGATLLEVVLSLTAWSLAQGAAGVTVAAAALAAVARNACPFLEGGMREQTAEWLLDALEVHLGTKTARLDSAPWGGAAAAEVDSEVEEGRWPSSWNAPMPAWSMGVASLLLEGLSAGAAFHHDEQEELVVAMVKRSLPPQSADTAGAGGEGGDEAGVSLRGGVFFCLAARGGLLEGGDGGGVGLFSAALLSSEESWFKVSVTCNPWEGWPMRRVLWPLLYTLTDPSRQATSTMDARVLMASVREEILRPLGLCPPWDKDNLDHLGQPGGESGDPKHTDILAADAVTGGSGGMELARRNAANMAAKIRSSVGGGVGGSSSASVIDPEVIESAKNEKRNGSKVMSGALSFQELRDDKEGNKWGPGGRKMDWVSKGGDLVDGVPEVGGEGEEGGRGGGLARVVVVEEPWQGVYLWSLLFVKIMSDVRVFDRRTIRLLEITMEDSASGATSSTGRGSGNTTVSSVIDDASYYTDASNVESSVFAAPGSDQSRSSPEDEYEQQTHAEQTYSNSLGASLEEEKRPAPSSYQQRKPGFGAAARAAMEGGGVAGDLDAVFEAGGGARAEELV